jgi:predicted phosphodiesterase
MKALFSGLWKKLLAWIISIHTALGGVLVLPIPIKFVTQPAVIIVSNTEYAVMWATNKRGTGDVIVTTGGEKKTYYDTGSGSIRSDDKLHVVRIAKEVLDNCDSYQVHSQYVLFSWGYFALKGKQATSASYAFKGYQNQETIRSLLLADIHGHKDDAQTLANVLKADAGADPNLVILAGDITKDWILNQKTFVDEVLDIAAKLSASTIPVLYARGNHETRGQWSSEMRRYFPTRTGELYFTANYGPISFTVLDTGEDKADDHPEYAGLADFAAYLAKEYEWLNSLEKDVSVPYAYRVCVAHVFQLNDGERYMDDWYVPMKNNLDITHMFCGHGHRNAAWVNGGIIHYEDGGPGTGSMLTFKNGEIFAKSMDTSGKVAIDAKLEGDIKINEVAPSAAPAAEEPAPGELVSTEPEEPIVAPAPGEPVW